MARFFTTDASASPTVLTLVSMVCAGVISLSSPSGWAQVSQAPVIVRVAGSEIRITLPDEPLKVSSQDLLEWVKSAARAVDQFYGRFPVPQLTLRLRAGRGDEVGHGVTFPKDGGLIIVTVGRGAGVEDLKDDWVLTHEMIHLAFPSMPRNQRWIEEGISTYVEPIARAQAGQLSERQVWKEFILNMPKGEPADGDQGLDNTPTWGRTYWGGAMFCLLCDIRIRELTQNRYTLQDSLRALLEQGGTLTQNWDISKAFAIGDDATGTDVLQSLYAEMRDKPAPIDLDNLWQKLGVALKGGELVLNDNAVDAPIRKAIVSPFRKKI